MAGKLKNLAKHLACVIYDAFPLFAVLVIATAILLPFRGEPVSPQENWFFFYLYFIGSLFIVWFWVHGGQTLGLLAWKMRVVRDNGEPLRWRDAIIRLAAANVSLMLFGLGFLWRLVDRDELTWHDRWSHTRLIDTESA